MITTEGSFETLQKVEICRSLSYINFSQMYSFHRSRVKEHDTSLRIRNEDSGQEEWKICSESAQQRVREILSTIVVTIALRVRSSEALCIAEASG